jgi:hypothetical protein
MKVNVVSNTALAMGVVVLSAFLLLQTIGAGSDPLIPAIAAFFIGCTAVLDRLGQQETE